MAGRFITSLLSVLAAGALVAGGGATGHAAEPDDTSGVSNLDAILANYTCQLAEIRGELEADSDEGGINWSKVTCFMNSVDPGSQLRDLRQGGVILDTEVDQHLFVIAPEDGGDEESWAHQETMRAAWIRALDYGGASDAEATYEQALEWSLGVVGCINDTDDAATSAASISGDWLTPGTEKYEVAKAIFDRLTQHYGTSGAFAAGVLGNVEQESSFNVEVTNSSSGAKGLFQFLPSSKAEPWMTGGSWSVENQVDAVWGLEFANRAVWGYVERNAPGTFDSLEEWLSTDDPEAAARAFLLGYERPGAHEAMEEKRKQNAAAANAVFNKDSIQADPSKFQLDGSSSSSSTSEGSSNQSADAQCDASSNDGIVVDGDWVSPMGSEYSWSSYEDGGRSHSGGAMDIPAPEGTPVYAPTTGKVLYASWEDGGGGNSVIIEDAAGHGLSLNHLSKIDVKVGDQVSAGDKVGEVGATGNASGPHLHFEIRVNGTTWGPWLRAYQFMKKQGVEMGVCTATAAECQLSIG